MSLRSLPCKCTAIGIVQLLILASLARAADVYVDAVNGDDTNGGTAWIDAWKTITHARYSVPQGTPSTIHVAPGIYDAANGEMYPISLPMWLEIVGVDGPAVTILDGGGSGDLFLTNAAPPGGGAGAPGGRLEGLWLRNANNGVYGFEPADFSYAMTARNAHVSDMSAHGFYLDVYAGDTGAIGYLALEHVRIWNCDTGARMFATSEDPGSSLHGTLIVRDSELFSNRVAIHSLQEGDVSEVTRCRITGNRTGYDSVGSRIYASDTLFASNAVGLRASGYGSYPTEAHLTRCTVASSTDYGLVIPFGSVDLASSILFGNGDDVRDGSGSVSGAFNDIGDGDLAGSNGNISADPLFVDAAGGDFRLAFGSPCADTGDPATSNGSFDLNGLARPIDGDLDTLERADMGAFELAPLGLTGTPSIGATIELELWGPAGSATLYWTRAPLAATPFSTPFGELDLDRLKLEVYAMTTTAPGPPTVLPIALPGNPALVGATFAFQALAPSTVSSPSMAFTNAVELTVVE